MLSRNQGCGDKGTSDRRDLVGMGLLLLLSSVPQSASVSGGASVGPPRPLSVSAEPCVVVGAEPSTAIKCPLVTSCPACVLGYELGSPEPVLLGTG